MKDIFGMAWGKKRVPLELASALDLHFSKGVLIWHFIEITVLTKIIKDYVMKKELTNFC